MKLIPLQSASDIKSCTTRPQKDEKSLESVVGKTFSAIRDRGDLAILEMTKRFDQVELNHFEVSESEIASAEKKISEELKAAILVAKNNIQKFHTNQHISEEKVTTTQGIECWRKSVGIQKVGLYIPGGTAPLFSTVLMLGIPANIAQCQEVVLCSPPNKEGNIHPAILYAASLVGIQKIYKVGGIQAIAAMHYGTTTVPKVYKIFGPGNQYVTAAKQYALNHGTAIDMPAGPSEVLVVADSSCEPAFVASDLLSQAEHGADSQVILVALENEIIEPIKKELLVQLEFLPRKNIAEQALENSKIILVTDIDLSIELINEYAPEHLILVSKHNDVYIEKIINAGSVFIGNYTPESAGDYASGTNHTLPTNGYAKQYSGVSVDSFVKKITYQKISKEGIQNLGPSIEIMAEAEELIAHKNAVTLRLKKLNE